MKDVVSSVKNKMDKSIDTLKTELAKLRTGRAHSSLLEHIQVDYYGNMTPLPQVANLAVENARTLLVTPWEQSMVAPIAKAIEAADLGLNPLTAGTSIHVPLPALTEERRIHLVKLVREQAEKARVAVRNIRRAVNMDAKAQLKDKEMTEDEEHRLHTEVQKVTDQYVKEIDKMLENKEKDLMEI